MSQRRRTTPEGKRRRGGQRERERRHKRQGEGREPSPLELLRLQVAEELGLGEKVRAEGWGSLSSRDNGRVGGRVRGMLKRLGLVARPDGSLAPEELAK